MSNHDPASVDRLPFKDCIEKEPKTTISRLRRLMAMLAWHNYERPSKAEYFHVVLV
jgi:hypothetical protein